MRHALFAALSLLLAPLVQAQSIPLREGLVLTNSVSRQGGSISTVTRVTAITPRLVKLSFTGQKADGSPLASARNVRLQDLKTARSIRANFVDGATELFEGSTAFGTSALVLGELKTGSSKLTVDVGGVGTGAGVSSAGLGRELDGMLEGMGGFAGISAALESAGARGIITASDQADGAATMGAIGSLQMAEGKLTATGKTTVQVLVNGQKTALPGVVAKGRLSKDKEAYEAELVFLDDPANPLLLKSQIGKVSSQLTRIDYPVQK